MKPFVSLPRLLMVLTLVMVPLASTAYGGGYDTHMGQFTSKHVHLVGMSPTGNAVDFKFYRVNLNGATENSPFKVPSGQALVVTDVCWYYAGGTSQAGKSAALSLSITNGTTTSIGYYVSSQKLDDNGFGIKNEVLTSGFLVGPNFEIKLTTGLWLASTTPGWATLRGYMVPPKN